MKLNFRGDCRGCITVIIHRFNFRAQETLVTVQDDLCTSHVGQVLEMETCVRGFHVYKAIWEAAFGEKLKCRRERGNRKDCYAVAVVKDEAVVGHVLRKILWMCN